MIYAPVLIRQAQGHGDHQLAGCQAPNLKRTFALLLNPHQAEAVALR